MSDEFLSRIETEIKETKSFLSKVREEIKKYEPPLSVEQAHRLFEIPEKLKKLVEDEHELLEDIGAELGRLREEEERLLIEFPPPYVAYSPTYGKLPRRKYVLLVRTYRSILEGRKRYWDAMRKYYKEMDRNRWTKRVAKQHGVSTRRVAIDLWLELEEGKIELIPEKLLEVRARIKTLEEKEEQIFVLLDEKREVLEEVEELLKLYRVEVMRVYYKRRPGKKRRTPDPFAEIRVWVYTLTPEKYRRRDFIEEIKRLERNVADSIVLARTKHAIYHVECPPVAEEEVEVEEIDWDEAHIEADESGCKFKLDEYFYYVVFYRHTEEVFFLDSDACTYWPPKTRFARSNLPIKTRPRAPIHKEYNCKEIKMILGEE